MFQEKANEAVHRAGMWDCKNSGQIKIDQMLKKRITGLD